MKFSFIAIFSITLILLFSGAYAPTASACLTCDVKTIDGFLEVNRDSKVSAELTLAKTANEISVINTAKVDWQTETIKPLFDGTENYPLDFKMVFDQQDKTKYKYSIAFTATHVSTFELLFGSETSCEMFMFGAQCGKTLYSFVDAQQAGFNFELKKEDRGFKFILNDLKDGEYYYIDPIIDSNVDSEAVSVVVNTDFTGTTWAAQIFKANHTGYITAVQIPISDIGNNITDPTVKIFNVASGKPNAILQASCIGTADGASVRTYNDYNWLDFNISGALCTVTAGTDYAMVFSGTNQYVVYATANNYPDGNVQRTTDSGTNWAEQLAGRDLFYRLWLQETNPQITSISRSPLGTLTIGNTITITPTGVSHPINAPLAFYCDENGASPIEYTSRCTQADTNYTTPYAGMTCSYPIPAGTTSRTISCRTYDGANFSNTVTTTYSIYSNSLNINFVNEKTGAGTKPDTLTIDGNSWIGNVDANGLFTITNLTAIPATIHSLKATKTGFGSRQWDYNFGLNTGYDSNFAMRSQDANSSTFSFQFYDTNGVAQIGQKTMQINVIGTSLIAGIQQTDTSAKLNYFLDTNAAKYTITAYNSDATKYLDYNAAKLVVHIPKDEVDLTNITPYIANLYNYVSVDGNGMTGDWNNYVYPNLTTPYIVTVGDGNTTYYNRQYSISLLGSAPTYTLQTYLLKKSVGVTVTFFSKDTATGKTLPNTTIVIKKYISGVLTTIESRLTDASGAATFTMQYNSEYYIDANYGALSIVNQILFPIISQYTIKFNDSTSVGATIPMNVNGLKTTYFPTTTTVDYNYDGLFHFGATVHSTSTNIATVIFTLSQDTNILYTVTQTNGGVPFQTYVVPIPAIDVNTTALTQGKNFDFNFTVITTDGNISTEQHTIAYVHNAEMVDTFNLLQQIPANTDPTSAAFAALFITILIVGLAIFAVGNHPSISIIGGMCLLFFGFINWIPITISIIACLGGFAFYYLRSGF